MKDIKTREVIKKVKAIDKPQILAEHMKTTFVKSKDTAERTQEPEYNSPGEYAADTTSGYAKSIAQDVAHKAKNKMKHPYQKTKENVNKAKDHFRDVKKQFPKERQKAAEQAKQTAEQTKQTADKLSGKAKEAQKTAQEAKKAVTDAKRTLQQTRQTGRQTIKTTKQSAKSVKHAEKTIKTSTKTIKASGKSSIKAAKNTVKTAEMTAKTAVKTAQQTSKAAQKSAQAAAKAAKMAVQASKAAAAATKAAVKATIALVKVAIAAIKGLVSLIVAGGWIAVVIIVIICLIALLIGSIFGIFFSGEDSGTGRSMSAVIAELNTEFYDKIEEIKSKNAHDVVDVGAMSIRWDEVLAVYAIKVNTDPDNATEVVTLDDGKVDKLRSVLNDMVSFSHSTKTETQERTVTTIDADGKEVETTEMATITTLVITLTHKSADDMAAKYGFSAKQKENLHELLSPQYANLWAQLLGGYIAGSGNILMPDSSHIPKDIFSWPMGEGFSITSTFGYRKDPLTSETKYHSGIDIGAPSGTPILAAADGTVTIANSTDSWGGGYGYHVKVQHNATYSTFYAHCSQIAVANGQEVKKGQVIAYVGSTGRSTGAHLHFEVYKDGVRANPLGYFE